MATGGLPVNVKLLLEGEEECGSPSLPGILRRHRDLLAADAVLSADGARWRPDLVTVNVGSRGNGALEITLRTAAKDLHSGRFGGLVPNAGQALAQLLATLHDREGRIAVAGFCDGLQAPDPAALAAIPFDAAMQAAAVGAEPFGDPDRHPLERLWYRPTIEINGLWGGYTGAGAKTVIPAEAHAKLTCRLAPGQDPAAARAALEAHLHTHCPPGARLTLHGRHGWTGAVSVPGDHPLLRAVEATLAARTATPPLRVRIGATLPLAEIVKDALGLDTVMFSYSTADEDFHAPDEFFRLASLEDGIAAWIDLLRRLGAERAADWAPWRR
jgi:acetylornithine deacetylase/succinyl-diaminopimelate desuccinylase-like protein